MPIQDFRVETEQEVDGRWIAEVTDLPGAIAYGETKDAAIANAEAIALRVVADRMEETAVGTSQISFGVA